MPERLSKYTTKVGASNLNSSYAKPVVVYAASRSEAVSRAIDIGWGGHRRDASVWILKVEDIDPRECPHVTALDKGN